MLFANYQIIPKAIVLPNNQDPDEYVKENGIDKLNQYFVANEKNVYAYLYDLAFKKFIKGDLEISQKILKRKFLNLHVFLKRIQLLNILLRC